MQDAIAEGGDLEAAMKEAKQCDAVADRARRLEANAAQADSTAPLCKGCTHRTDTPAGFGCAQGHDTKEAVARRSCKGYKAE